MQQWRKLGQITLNHLGTLEVKIWKPSADIFGWCWSCKVLNLERQYIGIADEDTAKQEVLKLVLEAIDKFRVMLTEASEELETLLLST